MTELNDLPEPAVEHFEAVWPENPATTGDEWVDSALARLGGIPGTPMAEHSGIYSGLHDSLLAALNAEPGNAARAMASGLAAREAGGAAREAGGA
jgi:hypothetical protein